MKPSTYVINGGDGDQSYFSEPMFLQDAAADWFSDSVLQGEGNFCRNPGEAADRLDRFLIH